MTCSDVGVQEAATAGEQRARPCGRANSDRKRLAASSRPNGRSSRTAGPQPAGLGLAFAPGIEHRDRRIVGVQREAGANIALDSLA